MGFFGAAHGWGAKKLLKISVFWNKGYGVTITVHSVTNKCLSRNLHYVADVIIWSTILTSAFCERSYHNLNFIRIWPNVFEGCSWFKLNNLGLRLGIALKLNINVAKGLKLKVRKFWVLSLTFLEVTGEKLVGDLFGPFLLKRVNIDTYSFIGPKQSSRLLWNLNRHVKVVRNINFKTSRYYF